MRPRPPDGDRLAQVLALLTVGTAVVLVLWNLRGMPWGAAPLHGEAVVAREQGTLITALMMCSALTAGMAALRPRRRDFLWFGVVMALFGMQVQHLGGLPLSINAPSPALAPWWSVLIPSTLGASLLFTAHMARQQARHEVRALVTMCGITALLALVLPLAETPWLEPLNQALTVLAILVAGRLYYRGLRDNVPSIGAVALATAMFSVTVLIDLFRPGFQGGALITGGLMVYAISITLALTLQLVETSEWYEEVIEQGRDAILVVGRDGHVQVGNPAALALLERPLERLDLLSLVVAEDRAQAAQHLESAERSRRAEMRIEPKPGRTLHVESLASSLPEERTLLVMRDITSRRQLEASLIEAARAETAAILAGGIAHDFNNAMGALLGNVELLRARADEATGRRLDRMEAVIRRASVMTRRLVSAVRGGETERSPMLLDETISSAVDLVRSMLPPEINLEVEVAADLPRVLGNPSELEHALLNLLLNARDAMPEGGVIRLQASRVVSGPYSGGASLVVEDDGPGVSPALVKRIWEPFFTTKSPGRGTGLGLSVVARVAREHGGAAEVGAARTGRGARFEILLPPAENTGTLSTGSSRVTARTLLVDDDPDVREHMRAELTTRGCEVVAVGAAEDAERAFDEAGGAFDLLVTDVMLPGRSGIELARTLIARRPSLAVLVVSGFIPENEPALDPAWGRLEKPFTGERFAIAVRRTMLRAVRSRAEA